MNKLSKTLKVILNGIIVSVFLFLLAGKTNEVKAAVAFDASSESHTGTAGSTSQTSFTWNHTPVGTPKGVMVFVMTHANAADITSVTYGGVTMSAVSGGQAIDTAGEPGRTDTYFLGSGIPTGQQAVVVNRTNNADEMYAVAITVTAAQDTETNGAVLLQEDGTVAEQSVNDGSVGTNSVRFAAIASGLASIGTNCTTPGTNTLAQGCSSTALQSIDVGQRVDSVVRETTAGQGARNVGFSASTSDDRAGVHIAIREKFVTLSGNVYQTDETTAYQCLTAGNLTINVRVNGAGSYSGTCTANTGAWSVSGIPATSGQTVYAYISANASVKGNTVLVHDGTAKSDIKIFQSRVVLRDDVNGTITNSEISAGNTADADDLIAFTGSNITITSTYELHVTSTDTYSPGGTVTTQGTGGKLHVDDNAIAIMDTATNTISDDVLVDGGATFRVNADTAINGGDITTSGTSAIVTTTSGTPTVTMSGTGAIGGGTTPTLTFYNLATTGTGTTTISNTTTVNNNISVGSGTSLQNNAQTTVTGNVAVTGKLTIAATLSINGGGLTTTGTGVSGVSINYSNTPATTITGAGTLGGGTGTIAFYDLTTNGSSQTTTVSTNNINIDNTLTIGGSHTFSLGTNSITVGSTATNSGAINVSGLYSQSSSGTTTVKSSSGGAATIGGTGCTSTNCTFGNLSFLPAVASAPTFTLGSASGQTITVTGALSVGNGTNAVNVLANTNNATVNVTGAMTVSAGGGTYTSGTSTLTVGGAFTNSGTFYSYGALDFNGDFSNSGSGGFTAPASASFTIAGSFTNGASATFTANGGTVTLDATTGSPAITSAGDSFYSLTINNGGTVKTWTLSDALDVNGNLSIGASNTLSTSTFAVNVAGNWSNSGTYTASNTTTLDGASGTTQIITGSTTFSTLTITNTATRVIQVANGSTQTISSAITLGGSGSCNSLLLFRSGSLGSAFTLVLPATVTASYVDFQDTKVNTNNLLGTGITDSGGNNGGTATITFDNTCEGASNDANATNYSFQRKTFKDTTNSVHWMFFYDGSQIEYKYSSNNGTNWTHGGSLAYTTNDFSVWHSKISTTDYVWLAVASGGDIVLRRGTLGATSITWDAASPVVSVFGATGYSYPYISLDSSNYIWVGVRQTSGANYNFVTRKSANTADSTWTAAAFTFGSTLTLNNTNTNSNVYGNIVPLASGGMYSTFVVGSAMLGCRYDAATDLRWEDSSGNACSPTAGAGESSYFDSLSTGLVAYYKMDESSWNGTTGEVTDSSGNSLNGTRSGIATTAAIGFNRSGNFVGASDYASVADPGTSSVLDLTSAVSISAWINPSSLPALGAYKTILTKGETANTNNATYMLKIGNNSTNKVISFCFDVSGTTQCWDSNNIADMAANTWQNIGISYTYGSTTSIKAYYNGTEIGGSWRSGTGSGTPDVSNEPIWIAADNYNDGTNTPEEVYSGYIDDLKLYNTQISAENFVKIYRQRPERVNISDSNNYGTEVQGERQIVRTYSGNLYAVIFDSTSHKVAVWKSTDGVNWSEKDSANEPTTITNNVTLAAGITSTNVIQIAFGRTDISNGSWLSYTTFATSTDQWNAGAAANIETIDSSETSYTVEGLAVDNANLPHIIYNGSGSALKYRNRVSGSWSAATTVEAVNGDYAAIAMNSSTVPEISYINLTNSQFTVALGNANNATSFTLYDVDTSINVTSGQQMTSYAIDTLTNNSWVSYVDGTTNYIALAKYTGNHSAAQWNGTYWTSITSKSNVGYEPSIAIAGSSDIYVFYQAKDSSPVNHVDDIAYDIYNSDAASPSWAGETVLQSGTFQDVKVKSSYEWNNFAANKIDYLFSDASDIFVDQLRIRRSPVIINDSANMGGAWSQSASRNVLRDSSGNLYTISSTSNILEVWESTDGGNNWTEQDSANHPAISSNSGGPQVSAAIDSSNTIHIAYSSADDIYYLTFSGTFSSSTLLYNSAGTSINTVSSISISIDQSDAPHVLYSVDENSLGTDNYILGYINKTGGTWQSNVTVDTGSGTYLYGDLTIDDENLPELAYLSNLGYLTAAVGNANNATSFTTGGGATQNIDTTASQANSPSIGIDSAGNTWVAYINAGGNVALLEHLDASAWSSWQTAVTDSKGGYSPSISIDNSDIYVFYKDVKNDIHYDKYSSGAWSGPTLLEEHGVLTNVKAKWSYLNNYDSTGVAQVQTNTYYFDNSDSCAAGAGCQDPQSVWTNDANAFDADMTTNNASSSTTGSVSSNYLRGDGTNAPGSGGTIVSVKARVKGSYPVSSTSVNAAIYSGAELLGTPTVTAGSATWSTYTTLTAPTGGWNWTAIQALSTRIYVSGTTGLAWGVQIMVQSTNTASVNQLDYLYSDNTDLYYNRLLAGSTPGSQDSIDSTVSSGLDKNLSAVSDSTNYDVHLIYVDSDGSMKYARWDNGTTTWQTAVAIDASTTDTYPTLSIDTNTRDLYAFYIDSSTGYVNYVKCTMDASECSTTGGGGDWGSENNWQTYSGTKTALTSDYGETSDAFAQWSVGTTYVNVDWARISISVSMTITQNDFKWYVTANSVTLTDPWPSGALDLGENAEFTQLPAKYLPLSTGDRIRIQMNFTVTGQALSASTQRFQLQYASTSTGDCTTASGWTAVDAKGGGGIWRLYDEAAIGDSTTQVNDISTSTAGAEGYYSEINPSAVNPNQVSAGANSEWDWPVEDNGALSDTTYCFRMVKHDGASTATAFDTYNADSYPKLSTAPGVDVLMRHGQFFLNGVKKGFYWAD